MARASWASVCGGTWMPGSGAPGTSQKNSGSFRHCCTWAWVSFGLTGSSYHVPGGHRVLVDQLLGLLEGMLPVEQRARTRVGVAVEVDDVLAADMRVALGDPQAGRRRDVDHRVLRARRVVLPAEVDHVLEHDLAAAAGRAVDRRAAVGRAGRQGTESRPRRRPARRGWRGARRYGRISRLALLSPRIVDDRVVRDHLPLAVRGLRQLVGEAVVVVVGHRLAGQDRSGLQVGVDGLRVVEAGGDVQVRPGRSGRGSPSCRRS